MHVRIHKILAGEGTEGVQLQTRVGPTKFHHFKTHNFEKRGRGFGPRSPSGSALEMLFFPMRGGQLESNQGKPFRIMGTSP